MSRTPARRPIGIAMRTSSASTTAAAFDLEHASDVRGLLALCGERLMLVLSSPFSDTAAACPDCARALADPLLRAS
ncbi:MAG: hypothetical protein LCI03_16045 [Actinobacteria bacterium]|jgi:hypothetical protein|nr:hypothetical protein [Actinomycetota bacterium]